MHLKYLVIFTFHSVNVNKPMGIINKLEDFCIMDYKNIIDAGKSIYIKG